MVTIILIFSSDGHGVTGHEVSKYIKENLPESLNNDINKNLKNGSKVALNKIIEEVFLNINSDIFNEITIDTNFR